MIVHTDTEPCRKGRVRNFMKQFVINNGLGAVIALIFTTAVTALTAALVRMRSRYGALQRGLRALLHNDIYRIHQECVTQGYCSIHTLDNACDSFKEFIALGGDKDGAVKAMIEALKKLPTVKPE